MGDTTRKASADEPPLPLPTGAVATEVARREPSPVPGFDAIRELARGGMGLVLEAWSHALGRPVALKLLRPEMHADSDTLLRLEREVAAQVRLTHPNIVRVLESGSAQGSPWLALELVPGESLEARLRREGPPPPARTAAWMADLAGAVAHAHAHGVLHRDLKPANVVFGADQVPRLIDFGLAYLADAPDRLTATGMLLGTPSYMAPEQVRGERGSVDERTDVYGLGAILYQLLTGSPPFPGTTSIAVYEKVLTCDPVAPSRVLERVDPLLEAICLRCLARDPARRFGSAAELQAALAAWRPRSPIRRRRRARWLLTGATALVAVAAALVGLRRQGGQPASHASAPAAAPVPDAAPPPDPLAVLQDLAPTWSGLVASARAARAAGLDHDLSALESRVPDRAVRARLLFALHVEQAEDIRGVLRPTPALRLLAGDAGAPSPWSNLARALVAADARDMARARDAIEQVPDSTWAALLRAPIAHDHLGPEGTRATVQRALELDPSNRLAAFTLAEQEARMRQPWDAEAILRALAPWDGDPAPPRGVLRLRCEASRLLGRGFEAAEDAELLVERDPRDSEALLMRAALRLTVMNEPTLALNDVDLAGDAGATGLRLRVKALEALSEWEALLDALERLRVVSRSDAERLELDAVRLIALIELRRDAAAEALVRELAPLRPPHAGTAQLLAQAVDELRRRRAQPVRGGSPRELLDRAMHLRGRGELRAALDHLHAALSLAPADPAPFLRLRGFVRMDLRHLGAAIRDLEAARPLDPDGLHALGSALFQLGAQTRAAAVHEELLQLEPDNLEARITLALLRLSLSPGPESSAEYERLLRETTGLDRTVLLRNRMDLHLLRRDYPAAQEDLRALREHVGPSGPRLPELPPEHMDQLAEQLERLVRRRVAPR